MKKILVSIIVSMTVLLVSAQKLSIEKTFKLPGVSSNSNLANVEYNPEDKTTSLQYIANWPGYTVFDKFIFNEQLEYVKTETKKYTFIDMLKDYFKTQYSWFGFNGEDYTKESVWVYRNFKQEIIAKKVTYNYKWNWLMMGYSKTMKFAEKVVIKGLEGGRLFLYDRIDNSNTGDVIAITGLRRAKGDKDKTKVFQQARKFQFIKIKSDFTSEILETIYFPHNMGISFIKTITNKEIIVDESGSELDVSMGGSAAGDLGNGDIAIVFSPIKSMLGSKFVDPNPGNHVMVIVGGDGKIKSKVPLNSPTSGWVIEDFIMSDDGKDVYFYGPAKDGAYVNKVQPVNSAVSQGQSEVKDIKYKNFQLMKLTDNKLAWIKTTDIKEFSAKAVNPPSQKKSPDYTGKNFEKSLSIVTPAGEVIIAGQKYTTKRIPDPNSNVEGATMKVKDAYKHLVMFHFGIKGDLKAQYGVVRDKNNKWAKRSLTPQYAYCNEDASKLYWVYGEIKGLRRGFSVGGMGLSKKKLLFYPTVGEIDLVKSELSEFESFGAIDDKQVYFTNPNFPQLLSPDKKNITFIGEDKPGEVIWLGRFPVK